MLRWEAGVLGMLFASLTSDVAAVVRDTGAPIVIEDRTVRAHADERPSGVAVRPDGKHVYVARADGTFPSFGGGLTVFERNSVSGALSLVEELFHVPGVTDGLRGLGRVFVSPDGLHLYAVGLELLGDEWAHEGLLNRFSRDPVTGHVTYLGQAYVGENEFINDMAPSSDGRHYYVAGFEDYWGTYRWPSAP